MDFEVQRCTRQCAKTQRQLRAGEKYYSALVAREADVVRYDFAEEAWEGPPEGTLGWWKSQIPTSDSKRTHWAPNDVMLDLFDQWEDKPQKQEVRYVLTLLLVRRRMMRLEETQCDPSGREHLVVYCPRREATYTIEASTPSEDRIQEIQNELAQLLLADNDENTSALG